MQRGLKMKSILWITFLALFVSQMLACKDDVRVKLVRKPTDFTNGKLGFYIVGGSEIVTNQDHK